MSNLPQETIDRIKIAADNYAFQVPFDGTKEFYNKDLLEGYKAGATAEANRAIEREKVLVEALKEIVSIHWQYHKLEGDNRAANHLRNIAEQALALTNYAGQAEKEVENE